MVWPGPPPQGSSKPGTQPTFSIRLNGGGKRHWLFGGGSGEGMTEWSLKKPPLVFLTFPPVTAMLSICCPIPCHIWFRQSPPPSIWMQSQRLTPSILGANLIRQHHNFFLGGQPVPSLFPRCQVTETSFSWFPCAISFGLYPFLQHSPAEPIFWRIPQNLI